MPSHPIPRGPSKQPPEPWRQTDLFGFNADVRFWHKADVQIALMNVRFEGNNGHGADMTRCLLMTQSGHPQVLDRQ